MCFYRSGASRLSWGVTCLPFYSFQGEGSGYICGKKVKWRKDEREKQKRWPQVRPSSFLSGGSSFPCSAEMQQALIFWPLHPLVQHVVAMLRPVCFCTVEDGRYGHPNLRREGSRWYNCRYPRRCRGMDVAMVEWPESCWVKAWFPCSCSLCTVTSVPSAGVGAVVRVPVASCLARGFHVSLGRGWSTPKGSGAPVLTLQGSDEAKVVPDRAQGSGALMTLWGSGEAETTARGAYLARDLSVRLRRDGGWLSGLERLICCQRLWWIVFTRAPITGL
jgi:hypothetical protein